MKKIVFLLALLAFPAIVQSASIETLDILVSIDQSGNAGITETYIIQFTSPFEEREFQDKAIENSSSVSAWMADYEFFTPHFALDTTRIRNSSISYAPEFKRLVFEYTLKDSFARLTANEQRANFFIIDDRQLGSFIESGSVIVPENITLRIRFPPGAEIDQQRLPEKAVVSNNEILLSGIQSNNIRITYMVPKPIVPTTDLVEGISNLYLFMAPVAILLIVGYIKRDEIEEKVEDYLVKHSKINKRENDEDINLDFDENP
ncbi:MAG: hypothetical protein NUV67_03475 [archaeon]|nr:hypothetical protein [archaeon]